MKIGFLSSFNEGRIEFARRHGFRAVELLVRGGDAQRREDRDRLRNVRVDGAGLRCSLHLENEPCVSRVAIAVRIGPEEHAHRLTRRHTR
jgi:hypothetical protein